MENSRHNIMAEKKGRNCLTPLGKIYLQLSKLKFLFCCCWSLYMFASRLFKEGRPTYLQSSIAAFILIIYDEKFFVSKISFKDTSYAWA